MNAQKPLSLEESNQDLADICQIELDQEENSNKYKECLNISSLFTKNYGSRAVNPVPKPNYFFCVRVQNLEIIKGIDQCHQHIIQNHSHYVKALCKIETMHITLCVMYINNNSQIDFLHERINQQAALLNKKLELRFHGLSTFRNQVVYVDLARDQGLDNLLSLQANLAKVIENSGVYLCDKSSFTPHMTLMKLSRSKDLYRKGIKKIDQKIYEHMKDHPFGVELIDSVHLCSITEKDPDGFYRIKKSFKIDST